MEDHSTAGKPGSKRMDIFDQEDRQADDYDHEPEQLTIILDGNIADLSAKEDRASLEYPLFSLSKSPDRKIREYSRGGKVLKIIPSVVGAANQFDKDLLIWAVTRLVDLRNREPNRRLSRTIRFETYSFLKATKRSTGGAAYKRLVDSCQRLRGTVIQTNIQTTEGERTSGFGMIDTYDVVRSTKDGSGALELELTVSDWLYRQIEGFDVLTLDPGYFALKQPIERRLYELARKHCGDQPLWKVGIDVLLAKSGSRQLRKHFMVDLKKIAAHDNLPSYQLLIDESGPEQMAVFVTRDTKKLHLHLLKNNLAAWYTTLTQGRIKNLR